MTENWRPIPKWEGFYSVSDKGRIRSESRSVAKSDGRTQYVPERILKTPPDSKGRPHAQLFKQNVGHTVYVHQAVLSAFIGPRPAALQVCHNNGKHLDNRLTNLRYDTDSANKLDSVRHGTHANSRKTHCPQSHPYSAENTYLDSHRRRHCRTCKSLKAPR